MINTINQLVNQINQTEKELTIMNGEIFEIEMDKLNEIIEVAKHGLHFKAIYENAFGQEAEYYDEEEYFRNDDGEILNGTLVYFSGEFYEETEDGDREINTEIFLIEDGSLMVFQTFSESHYCENCEQVHCHSHRVVAKDQTLNSYDNGVIINIIVSDLKSRASFLEERKSELMVNWIV